MLVRTETELKLPTYSETTANVAIVSDVDN